VVFEELVQASGRRQVLSERLLDGDGVIYVEIGFRQGEKGSFDEARGEREIDERRFTMIAEDAGNISSIRDVGWSVGKAAQNIRSARFVALGGMFGELQCDVCLEVVRRPILSC